MKSKIVIIAAGLFLLQAQNKCHAQDPILEVIKQGIKKVIKAVDLKIQRLQNETIWLQNAQKTLENTMSKLKLDEITGWVERQRELYADYFDELWRVKTAIMYYHRVKDIIDKQKQLVEEYKRACSLARQDKHFSTDEIDYMVKVYTGILNESVKNLDQVFLVINAFATQMSDAKRLDIINTAADNIEENLTDLRQFNTQNIIISIQRAKELRDVEVIKKLYGLEW